MRRPRRGGPSAAAAVCRPCPLPNAAPPPLPGLLRSALNAVAGAYAESLPLIVITGGPNSNDFASNRLVCGRAEGERQALHHRRRQPPPSARLRLSPLRFSLTALLV